jgi:hypothetical protein
MYGLGSPTRYMRGIPYCPYGILIVYRHWTALEKLTADINIIEHLPLSC